MTRRDRRPGLVVVGTDTGVGKTCVAAGLVRAWRRRGVAAVPWKPLATGVRPGELTPGEDADLLLRAAGWDASRLADVSPVRLSAPLAPEIAARRERTRVDVEDLLSRVPDEGDVLVVEGCGGLLVPIAPGWDVRELCWALDLPLLVVARPGLGTINHTALTLEAARNAGLRVAGVVLSGFPGDDPETARLNPEALTGYAGAPLVLEMPRVAAPDDVDALADAVEAAVPVEALLATIRPDADRARRLADADRKHVWHPFTQMKEWQAEDPVVVERAKGAWLYDTEGRRYLDGVSSLWVTVHGHREPALDAAVHRQLGRVAHSTLLGLAGEPSVECAEELLSAAPRNLARVFYSDSGSTAVEVALKMAFQGARQAGEPRRRLFVRFEGAYHGDTLGAVSVGGIDLFHRTFEPLLFETLSAPAPTCYRCPLGKTLPTCGIACLEPFEKTLAERGEEIAAVVVEPAMQAAAGMIPQPAGWLPRVAQVTKEAGALLICDEVATGFGRTGRMFAVEHENVRPDILCAAKGMTGGYLPLAATLTTERVHDAFLGDPDEARTFFHGHTYTGNPLACAAAVANLRAMKERGTAQDAGRKGEALGGLLAERVATHPNVGDVRRRGLMTGIEIVRDRTTREPFDASERIGWRVCRAAMRRGLRIRPLGDVVVLMPPLAIEDPLLLRMTVLLREALDEVLPPRGGAGAGGR